MKNPLVSDGVGDDGSIATSLIVGVYYGEVPPVPIPNTEVKLTGAENTWLATVREDRSMPIQMKRQDTKLYPVFFFQGGIQYPLDIPPVTRPFGADRGLFSGK